MFPLTRKTAAIIPASMFALALLLTPVSASTEASVVEVPTAWRVQDYLDGALTAWYTGASCSTGRLYLSSSASEETRQRFWSMVMTAKLSHQKVGVFYTSSNDSCTITSFFLVEE